MYLSATQIDSQYLSSSISSSNETIEEMSPNKRQRFQETILALNDNSQLFPTLQPKITNQPVKIKNTASFYGLPLKVKDLLKDLRNISQLYEWQSELMEKMLDRYERVKRSILKNTNPVPVDDPLNLLYLSPTSGGKTLVAELLMLYTLLIRKLDCIFVMPFVSIVQEKVKMLEEFGEHLNFYIEEYAGVKGMIPPIKRQLMKNKRTLYICTIEKANSLINSLIETDRLDKEIGLVVADELHMIGDGPRGFIYESLLTKIKYSSKQMLTKSKCFPIQIVATTATLENKRELADFLDAILYERNFRPVELREFIKLDRDIYELNKAKLSSGYDEAENCIERFRELDLSRETAQQKKDDPDNLVSLVAECIPNESCLVFCPSKKNCENVASLLVKYLPSELKQHKRDMKLKLFHELKEENSNNVCPVLRQSIQFGIAYHHSGLTSEERQLIEQAFREGTLCLLTCTSTLAAGVNLPAKRVIIRSPYVGFEFISGNQYRQMIGRAGRAGLIDSTGESILVFKNQDRQKVLSLITGSMKRCESSFECNSSLAFSIFVLSLIALNLTHLGSQILFFFKQTLFYLQYRNKIGANKTESNQDFIPEEFEFISNALVYLIKNGFIKSSGSIPSDSENTRSLFYSEFEVTQLGKAAIRGNIDLECVNQLYTDLKFGLKSLVLSNYLHLIYLCTPYELVNGLTNFDFDIYLRKFGNLNEEEVKCANFIGIQEEYIRKKRMNQVTAKKVNEAVFKRFYLTLVIYELWKTNNEIWTVANEFQMDRGFVQTIVQSAASFSSGVLHFCEQIDEFWPYNNLLKEFIKRLQYNCSSVDLIVLLELDSVKLTRAKQLFEAGYKTLESIASAKDEDLSAKVRNLQIPIARRIIKSAKKILKEKAEILQEEAENLLLQIKI